VTDSSYPRVSIITATFNAAAQLPYTIRSLREQISHDFEWIVVDGGSSDGTQSLLRENEDLISRWISEPDQGIYDAFNKACAMARGEWLLFLGAGDVLAAPQTLEECLKYIAGVSADTTLVYGRQTLLSPVERTPLESCGVSWPEMKDKWDIGRPAMLPHGATFNRKSLFNEERPFDLRFSIASDSHFIFRAIRHQAPLFIPVEVSRAPIGGVSFRLESVKQQAREIAAINRDLGLIPPLSVRIHERLRIAVISFLNLLPRKVAHWLADFLRRLMGKTAHWTVR
jgi:hypothetical protein